MSKLVNLVNYPSVKITVPAYGSTLSAIRHSFKASLNAELFKLYPELEPTLKKLDGFTKHGKAWLKGSSFLKGIMYGYPLCCSAAYGNNYDTSVRRTLNPNTTVYESCPLCRNSGTAGILNRKVTWDSSSKVNLHRELHTLIKDNHPTSDLITAWVDFALEEYEIAINYARDIMHANGFDYVLQEDEIFQCALPFSAQSKFDGKDSALYGRLFVVNTKTLVERHILQINFVNDVN